MVLPLFAAFVKGAAEAGEDMIDFKAKNDAEKAALAKKYEMDFQNKKRIEAYKTSVKNADRNRMVGPYGYMSDQTLGSLQDQRERLAQFEAGLKNDPRKYALWQKENPTLVDPLKRGMLAAFGRIKDKDIQKIKIRNGSDRLVSKILMKTPPEIARTFNLNEPIPDDLKKAKDPITVEDGVGGAQTVTPPNAKGPKALTGTPIRSGNFLIKFAMENVAFQSDPTTNHAEYIEGAKRLKRNFENNAQKGDVRSRETIKTLSTTNAFVTDLMKPIKFERGGQTVTLYPADILGGGERDVDGRNALIERLYSRVKTADINEQAAQASLVTRAFRALNYMDVQRDQEEENVIGSQFESYTDIVPGAASKYTSSLGDKNPQTKEWTARVRRGQANEKLVNMLGTMEELIVNSGGTVGGNFLQKFRGTAGGAIESFINMIDSSLFNDVKMVTKAKTDFLQAITNGKSIGNQALFDTMQQFVAFAMAQIVQTGADKISNADVENMKQGLGGAFRSSGQQLRIIRRLRSESMKNLMAYGGYMQSLGGTTNLPQDYGDFISAQYQHDSFKSSTASFASSEAFEMFGRKISNQTINQEGVTYRSGLPSTSFKDQGFAPGTTFGAEIANAIAETSAAYVPTEEDSIAPYFVQAYKAAIKVYRTPEYQKVAKRFGYGTIQDIGDNGFAFSTDHYKAEAMESMIDRNLPEDIKANKIGGVQFVHVRNYGFVPFIRRSIGNKAVMKRLIINGKSMFVDKEDLSQALSSSGAGDLTAAQNVILTKAGGGSVSIADRLKNMQTKTTQGQI